ncbi:hypothetical protein OG21DRAFT_1503639 [Imleria badia]|nr:hypothetical protein OG21DRAFT_1503639 [Imleria badia]
MSTDQTRSSWVSAAKNGNYNQATCQPSTYHSKSRHTLQVPANHKPVCVMTLEADRPASQAAGASYVMPTARRLLAEARQTMFSESRQPGRNATIMDVVLDHRLLISVSTLLANGRHRSPVPRNCALGCQADVDAYWAEQKESSEFVSTGVSKIIEPPVSAERSTMAWPPNLDGDGVWD